MSGTKSNQGRQEGERNTCSQKKKKNTTFNKFDCYKGNIQKYTKLHNYKPNFVLYTVNSTLRVTTLSFGAASTIKHPSNMTVCAVWVECTVYTMHYSVFFVYTEIYYVECIHCIIVSTV